MAAPDSDNESTDPGYRSRSQSRRARRKKQTNKQQKQMSSVPEEQAQQQQQRASAASSAQTEMINDKGQTQSDSQAVGNLPNESKPNAMQPFEWIGPDSSSMDGPVTFARAQRGEIPMRPGNPNQGLETSKKSGESNMMDQEGLKLRIELNIDIEIELKARIHGDLTLALL